MFQIKIRDIPGPRYNGGLLYNPNTASSAHLVRILSALEQPRGVTCGRTQTSYTRQHECGLLPGWLFVILPSYLKD